MSTHARVVVYHARPQYPTPHEICVNIEFDLRCFINIQFIDWWSFTDNCHMAIQSFTCKLIAIASVLLHVRVDKQPFQSTVDIGIRPCNCCQFTVVVDDSCGPSAHKLAW